MMNQFGKVSDVRKNSSQQFKIQEVNEITWDGSSLRSSPFEAGEWTGTWWLRNEHLPRIVGMMLADSDQTRNAIK